MTWLLVTFGVAVGSALLPLISVEVFVITMASSEPSLHWAAIAAVVAAGQLLGKLPYFLAARGSIHLPAFLHRRVAGDRPPSARRDKWRMRTKRLRAALETLRERCHQHPHWMVGTYGFTSVVGLPPYMAMVVLAGLAEMRMSLFVGLGLAGRFVRFAALAAGPALFLGWFGG
ncbi:MAG: hypothetical protein ACRDQB_11200 [Thermocrispum sp.]